MKNHCTAKLSCSTLHVCECRDSKDDKFLDVALNGRGELIITGDADLLDLHPWQSIAILSPAQYLRR